MERIIRGRSATLSQTFFVDGVPADPTVSPTVTVTRSDGTAVTTGAVTDEAGVGVWSVTIPASSNTLLDTLTVDWAATVNGQSQEYLDTVEVAGGHLFSIADVRALGLTAEAYPSAKVERVRLAVEQRLERACGVAFVPRYQLESFPATLGTVVVPRWPFARNVRSVTRDGTTVTPTTSAVNVAAGSFYFTSGWTYAYSTVTVGYEHGHTTPEEPVRVEALRLAKLALTASSSSVDPRVVQYTTDDGSVRYADTASAVAVSFPVDQAIVADYGMIAGVA